MAPRFTRSQPRSASTVVASFLQLVVSAQPPQAAIRPHASRSSGRYFCPPGVRLPTAEPLPTPKLLSRVPPLPLLQVALCTLRLAPHTRQCLVPPSAQSPKRGSLRPHPRRSRTNQRSPWSLTIRASPWQPILPRAVVNDGRRCALQSNYPGGKSEPAQLARPGSMAGDGTCTC